MHQAKETMDPESSSSSSRLGVPEIDVRFSEHNILIKIHCHRGKGVLAKAIVEIENRHLKVVGANAAPFTDSLFQITVIAQVRFSVSNDLNEILEGDEN